MGRLALADPEGWPELAEQAYSAGLRVRGERLEELAGLRGVRIPGRFDG